MVVRLAVLGFAAVMLCSCASLQPIGVTNDGNVRRSTLHELGAQLNGPELTMPTELTARFMAETPQTSTDDRRNLRREAIEALIRESNNKCRNYMTGVGAVRNGYGISFSTLSSLLTAIGSVVTQGAAANAFSAASGFSQTTSNTVTATLFGGREFNLIQASVWAGRQPWQNRILLRASEGHYDTWSPSSLLTEAQEFDRLCGVSYGLERLFQVTQTSAAQGTNDG